MLEYYKNYLMNLAQTPNESYRELEQAIVSSCFDNTTLLKTIEEEKDFDFDFEEIQVWLGTVTDAITNPDKDVKDYRYLYFEDCTHKAPRGKYYHFDGNYWMVYEEPTELESLSNCKVRRCNNEIKWIDKNTGELIKYPCIIEYSLSAPSPQVSKKVTVPNSHITVIVQGNQDTNKLEKNQRFVFNEETYRFVAINNYMKSAYHAEDANLLFLDCYLDIQQSDDDIKNNVANTDDYVYKIKIVEESFRQTKGFKGTLHATIMLNGSPVERKIKWKSLDENVVVIDENSGDYELVGNVGENCVVVASIEDSDTVDTIDIVIEDLSKDNIDLVVFPTIECLKQYESVVLQANLYNNGIKQNDKVECVASGADEYCYNLIDKGNNTFELINNRISKTPLKLKFKCNTYEKELNIKLISLF